MAIHELVCILDRIECHDGFFGEVCENSCSEHCTTPYCDINNGSCECKRGYGGYLVQNVHQTETAITIYVIISYIVFHVYLDITVISVTRPVQSIVRTPVTETAGVHVMLGTEVILVNPAL